MHQTVNMKRHDHDNYEFHYIARGQGLFEIDGISRPVRENHFFFTLPGESHRIYRRESNHYLFQYLCHLEELPADLVLLLASCPGEGRFLSLSGKKADWERWGALLERQDRLGERIFSLQFESLLWEAYGLKSESPPRYSSVLEASLNYIHNRLDRKITLDNLSRNVDYDKFQLIRHFKKELGLTPQKYWLKLKVEGALDLIRENRLNLDEIAERYAFTDGFHLSRTVKKWTGKSPRAWRGSEIKPMTF